VEVARWLRAEWDRVAGYGCLAVGLALLVAGFQGVRHAADVIDEISYLVSGGIGAVFLLGIGATLLLSADLHDDFRTLHRIEEQLDALERRLAPGHPAAPERSDPPGHRTYGDAVRRARRLAAMGIAAGGVLFVAGSLRTAHQTTTDHMAGSVGVALTGTLLVALVAALLVAGLRRSIEARKAAVLGPWLADGPSGGALRRSAAPSPAAGPATGAAEPLFVVAGLHRYHRAGCKALESRAATEIHPADRSADLEPCGLCDPPGPHAPGGEGRP